MHIIIYGVGRSGTKAVQIYLSYLLAKKEGKVWINYEPLFWLTRKLEIINYEGIHYHMNIPHVLNSDYELSPSFRKFLLKLQHDNTSIVTKFIRANGRIPLINTILKPDLTVIVIRDLYEVLQSLMRVEWDFWSVGWEFIISWDNFVKELRKIELIDRLEWCLSQINDRLDQNAFYWYVMNMAALRDPAKNTVIVEYGNLTELNSVAHNYLNISAEDIHIDDDKFEGDNLHRNYPLYSTEDISKTTDSLNKFFYKSGKVLKTIPYIPYSVIGSSARINPVNPEPVKLPMFKKSKPRFTIEKTMLYEYFLEQVKNRISELKSNRIAV